VGSNPTLSVEGETVDVQTFRRSVAQMLGWELFLSA
jgi:hypothetical protein